MSKKRLAAIMVPCVIAIIAAIVITNLGQPMPSVQSYTLSTHTNPLGAGSISPLGGEYQSSAQFTLTASPASGYRFVNWSGDVSSIADVEDAITTITMNDHYSITANFALGILEIRDWYDLDAIRDNLGASYRLMNDLDSTAAGYMEVASEMANGGKGWEPIGTELDQFTGSLDGQGHEIRDLFINRPGQRHVGLFAHIFWIHPIEHLGVIENVGLVNADVTGGSSSGGLVGDNQGVVNNSYFTGKLTGGWYVGGLAGCNSGTVSNSHSTGNITGNYYVGGLLGHVTGQATVREGIVSNCYSTGSVTGATRVGGLIGSVLGDCTVSNSYSTGTVTGYRWVGGLVAMNHGGSVRSSFSTGNVTGHEFVGGLVGLNLWGAVSDCYHVGKVTGDRDVGGLVGQNEWSTITDSCSAGGLTGDTNTGGLVGYSDGGSATESFWDTVTGGEATSAGGTGKTTAEMQDTTTFTEAGWNITAVVDPGMRNTSHTWNIVSGKTYPFLSWQPIS